MLRGMEHATHHQTASSPRQAHATHFDPRARLASDMPTDGYLVFGEYESSVPSMVGVIRLTEARPGSSWERHDRGDEVLIVLSGAFTMTLRDAQGRTTDQRMSQGDAILIPRGVAHHATLHTEEAHALFVTPRTGTKEWSDGNEPTAEVDQ